MKRRAHCLGDVHDGHRTTCDFISSPPTLFFFLPLYLQPNPNTERGAITALQQQQQQTLFINHKPDPIKMGFPVGCTEVFFPTIFLHLLSLLDFLKFLIHSLFRLLSLPEFLHSDALSPEFHFPINPPPSALLLREFLPVVKFSDLPQLSIAAAVDPPESCAVCLYEFEGAEEIRWLTNCKHIFHRGCLDRWMDHDHKTCPLCRTPFVADGMMEEFNQRLWATSDIAEFDSEFNSVLG